MTCSIFSLNNMRRYSFIFVFILSAILLPVSAGAASTDPCGLNSKTETLGVLKKAAPKTVKEREAAAKAELTARREILDILVNCSAEEAQKMQLTLREMTTKDDEISFVKAQFSNRYGSAFEFFDSKKRLVAELNLQGSKDMAKEIKEWRAENYAPLSEETANLILWIKNQDLFVTARGRLDRITETVKRFNLQDDEDMAKLLEETTADLVKAEEQNQAAKEAIKAGDAEEASAKVKESLETLSAVYKKFLQISGDIKKFLPL
jgi:hypothetical protein